MTACGVPWPVCPACLGEPLISSAGVSRCPRCRRRFADAARNPCPDEATCTVRDSAGGEGRMCRSHAVRALAQIIGSTAVGLDADALAASRSLPERDQETARIRARDEAQEEAELAGRVAPLDPARRAEVEAFTRQLDAFRRNYARALRSPRPVPEPSTLQIFEQLRGSLVRALESPTPQNLDAVGAALERAEFSDTLDEDNATARAIDAIEMHCDSLLRRLVEQLGTSAPAWLREFTTR